MLWNDPEAPRHGWTLIEVVDLGPDPDCREECEACAQQLVRYQHILRHEDYREVKAGCECSSKMIRDPAEAGEMERRTINISKRRAAFPNLSGWKPAKNGSGKLRLYKEGLVCVIKPGKFGKFTGSFKTRKDQDAPWFPSGKYAETIDGAKRDLFEAMLEAGII